MRIIIEEEDISCVETMGFDIADVEILIEEADGAAKIDAAEEVPEPKPVAVSRIADVWKLGKHRLLCGSCLDARNWETLMAGEKGSVAFCDPPYNLPVAGHVSGLERKVHSEFAMASSEMSSEEFIAFNRD